MQTRILYRNGNKILARITTNEIESKNSTYLNFKEKNDTEKVLKISQESPILEINEDCKKECFNQFWNKIVDSILKERLFCG